MTPSYAVRWKSVAVGAQGNLLEQQRVNPLGSFPPRSPHALQEGTVSPGQRGVGSANCPGPFRPHLLVLIDIFFPTLLGRLLPVLGRTDSDLNRTRRDRSYQVRGHVKNPARNFRPIRVISPARTVVSTPDRTRMKLHRGALACCTCFRHANRPLAQPFLEYASRAEKSPSVALTEAPNRISRFHFGGTDRSSEASDRCVLRSSQPKREAAKRNPEHWRRKSRSK